MLLPSNWRYQDEGEVRLIVHIDNCSYDTRYSSNWIKNEGDVRPIPDSKWFRVVLGPCFVSDCYLSEAEKCVMNHMQSIRDLYHGLTYPRVFKYILSDGQRWFWIVDARGVDHSLFLQNSHASCSPRTEGYQQAFWNKE
jgi:hypothetical protein